MTTASATVTVGHPDDVSRQNTTCDLHGRTSTTVDDGACGRCSISLVTRASAGETEDGTQGVLGAQPLSRTDVTTKFADRISAKGGPEQPVPPGFLQGEGDQREGDGERPGRCR
jgi:hypothetical protein